MTVTQFLSSWQLQFGATLAYQGNTTSTLLNTAQQSDQLQTSITYTAGTGTSQVNTLIRQVRVLAASGTEDLNFFSGAVTDVFGGTAGLAKLKFLAIYLVDNADGTTKATSVTIGGASATILQLDFGATNDTWTIRPNGVPFLASSDAGYTVDNTVKLLKILNNDGSNKATYLLLAAGVSN